MSEMTLYQKILETNLVNFIIMVSILVAIFKKAKLGRIFDKMADDIRNSVETSAQAAQAALKEYKEAKRSTKNTESEKQEILNKAKDAALNMENTATGALCTEEKSLDEKCAQQIEENFKKTKETTADEMFDAMMYIAHDEIKKRLLNENAQEIQKNIIEKSIEELDKIGEVKF